MPTGVTISDLPDVIESEEELDEAMTRPSDALVETIARLDGPLVILGASGKMGPSLAAMARRAAELAEIDLDVVAVARFSDPAAREWLISRGVTTLACDLMDRSQLASLPEASNVIYMAGRKFGTADNPELTWAMNTVPVLNVCERYPSARIVAMSTGCVYPLVPVDSGGSIETDELTPIGEYSNACVARERLFEHCSAQSKTPVCQIRLNYAIDLRYGVLADIAARVWSNQPIDLSMGYLNCIWQRDANDAIVRAIELATSPPVALNLTGAETLSVKDLARRLGALMNVEPAFTGIESPTALLSNPSRANDLLGAPPTSIDTMLRWIAHWTMKGGRTLGKPTHYEVRDGRY